MSFLHKGRTIAAILWALAVCSSSAARADLRQELRALYRLRHKQYTSSEVTGPEVHERIKLIRLMFHARDISRVRKILDTTLSKRRGWTTWVVEVGQRIEYDRRHDSVEYLSTSQYNFVERGFNNPGWYTEGKRPPRAYRGGCVVQYYTAKRAYGL